MNRGGRDERGSATLEAVLVVPAFCLFLGLVIALGRIEVARQHVDAAAAEAARSGSLARDAASATSRATTAAQATLDSHQLDCQPARVEVDAAGFAVPVGTPASLKATVTCQVNLSDIALPGLPGSITITRQASSPLDVFRGRR